MAIRYYATTLRDYGRAMTPKAHIIIFHYYEFCKFTNRCMGDFSEHDIEAMHKMFRDRWNMYKRPEIKVNIIFFEFRRFSNHLNRLPTLIYNIIK